MDNQASSQPQQSGQQQPPSVARNIKNLSIKEFFTTRLMRARSFESGGANSPKDETSNWFDEFKARMTKKSQANSNKQTNLGISNSTVEESNEDSNEPSEIGVRFASHQTKRKYNRSKDESATASLVKDNNCDTTYLSDLSELGEELIQISNDDCTKLADVSSISLARSKPKTNNSSDLRARFPKRISHFESPDFDTASINTIFNRRDSRYETVSRNRHKLIYKKLLNLITWTISYLIPFNYNLPWKLLSLINFTFVIIVIGLTSETKPELTAFSFFNGFICGLLIATLCFIILLISFIVKVIPKSTSDTGITVKETEKEAHLNTNDDVESSFGGAELKQKESQNGDGNAKQKLDDFSTFEVLESSNQVGSETLFDEDNDYKGWMIEFIGDYELRNKSEFKLKLMFVKIENRVLSLSKPKNSYDIESTSYPVFVQHRTYNLENATKFSANLLLPKNVRNLQKWIWSKKYPIKLEFSCPEDITSGQTLKVDSSKTVQLTLFARSCREKEEWFRRFKRIVEDQRLSHNSKRLSIQSELSGVTNDDGSSLFESFKSFRCRSPSPTGISKTEGVQLSRSSNLIRDSRKNAEVKDKSENSFTRTKSCEQLNADVSSEASMSADEQDQTINVHEGIEDVIVKTSAGDDSTLTKETAEIFSQAVEYSNFLDSQPNLNYKEYIERLIESSQEATNTSDWFNALTGRIFFDVFSHNYWSVWFKRKIQRKLHRIRLPYFMETLTLTTIDLGVNAPQFLNVVSHTFDSFGLSIDFDMTYSGGLTMTFETKLNLLKIKNDNSSSANNNSTGCNISQSNSNISIGSSNSNNQTSCQQQAPSENANALQKEANPCSQSSDFIADSFSKEGYKPPLSLPGSTRTSGESSDSCDSDSESSSDSSCDADVDEISDWEDYGAEKTRQSIVRFVDKIASSRYFQHATENRYIKKKLQDISNCPLVLIVQIQSLSGVLTLNVPPPQTDRIWYGFKPNPELTLKALPKMGDREVNLSHVTDWIEKKLAEEFRKILVIPNMEDIVLPVLKSDHLLYVTTTR